MNTKKIACLASTALVGSLLAATAAMAQSTGTTAVEEVVVTATSGPKTQGGAIVAVDAPKSRSTITQDFISEQAPGQTVLDALNILPGVNFTSNDAFGSSGGDLTLRGFDSQRIALLQDGVPLNDSGNYAIYPNQQLDPELISKVDVNLGTTDVDSPTAAAAGGTINYVTRKPSKDFGVKAVIAGGSENFKRGFFVLDTGEVGPLGTSAWISYAEAKNDIFNGPGKIHKKQFNARVYQPVRDNGDFVSLIANFNRNRNTFIRRMTLAQFQQDVNVAYDENCARTAPVAGTAQVDSSASTCYLNNINPSDNGNLRAQSLFHLTDNLILTVDPSFQYVLANGGGRTTFSETALQLRGGSTATGVDLNGDGDTLDTVRLYWPNTTKTRRYGVTSSLIWKLSSNQSLRGAYTYDYARHRQTGEATAFNLDGSIPDVFGGKDGYGTPIKLPDGTILRRRDRLSFATLNQFSLEYRGRFVEDKLLLNVGLRAPFFKRELNNFCYQQNTSTAYCTTQTPTSITGTSDGNGQTLVRFGTSTTQYGRPRQFERKYDDVLPNVGVSYQFTDAQSVYASYAETLSAPRTDDLYDQKVTSPVAETAKVYDVGYRYQAGPVLAAVSVWYNDFQDRIERAYDEDATTSYSINVGAVKLKGIDGQVGFKPVDYFSVYGSFSYVDSEMQDNIPSGAGAFYATKGKELPISPKYQSAVRVTWKPTDMVNLSVQGKFVGERWTNLENTEKAPRYAVWKASARYKFDDLGWKGAYAQLNVDNLFDEKYLGAMFLNINGTNSFQPGYPRAVTLSLSAEF